MANNLNKIDHIVVLMLENRSFDNLLGWLYDPDNDPPFDRPPRGQHFDGVSGKNLSNPIPAGAAGSEQRVVPVGQGTVTTDPNPDPGEEFQHVHTQLWGGNTARGCLPGLSRLWPGSSVMPKAAPMDGFVADYIATFPTYRHRPATYDDYKIIMNCFTPDVVPVLSGLAYHYAVCDRWFCSVPSQTMPNRSFVHSATSLGFVNNSPMVKWLFHAAPTIFNRLAEAGLPWKIYFDELDVISMTRLVQPSLKPYHQTNFFSMDQFWADAAAGALPAYSFIEPRLFVDHNDQHPPLGAQLVTSSVLAGEILINQIYQAVRSGPAWARTLLIITHDEHGGCYDHVAPPSAVPPDPAAPPGEADFTFDRLGARVPAVLVSPYIEAGTIVHTQFDHTSIIKTVTERWGLPSLTERDRQANDLSSVLSLDQPRHDLPLISPRPYDPGDQPEAEPLTDLQYLTLLVVAGSLLLDQIDQTKSITDKIEDLSQMVEQAGEILKLKTVGDGIAFLTEKLKGEVDVQ